MSKASARQISSKQRHILSKTIGQDNLHKHIDEVVPEEYQKCMLGMKRNFKQTLEIAETTSDPRIKLQDLTFLNNVMGVFKAELDETGSFTSIEWQWK